LKSRLGAGGRACPAGHAVCQRSLEKGKRNLRTIAIVREGLQSSRLQPTLAISPGIHSWAAGRLLRADAQCVRFIWKGTTARTTSPSSALETISPPGSNKGWSHVIVTPPHVISVARLTTSSNFGPNGRALGARHPRDGPILEDFEEECLTELSTLLKLALLHCLRCTVLTPVGPARSLIVLPCCVEWLLIDSRQLSLRTVGRFAPSSRGAACPML